MKNKARQTMASMMAAMLLLGCMSASAATDFDPAQYDVEELKEIRAMIDLAIPLTPDGYRWYDQNGILVESRGIKFEGTKMGFPVVWFYIDNQSGEDIYVVLAEINDSSGAVFLNRCRIELSNTGELIPQGTIYMSGTRDDFSFFFTREVLADYGITAITSIRYTLQLYGCKDGEIDWARLIDVVRIDQAVNIPVP